VTFQTAERAQQKIAHGETKTTMLAEPPVATETETGWFEGIANVTGVRDRQLDTSLPGSFQRTTADLAAGRVAWAVTRQHSDDPADVVGHITAAKETAEGLWIRGVWTSDPIAQQLRQAVASGAQLGLSITYLPRGSRRDGQGGRLLTDIDVTSIAITNIPASAGSYIRAGKGLPPGAPARTSAPVVTVKQNIAEAATRNAPTRQQREQMAAVVAASSLSPDLKARLSLETAFSLVEEVAARKAAREAAGDPDRQRERERRDRLNRQSAAMHATMKLPPVIGGCGHCLACRNGGGPCIYA
jgi:hypothetical protein